MPYQGSFIIEHRGGRVSNVSFAAISEARVMEEARALLVLDPDIVCIRVPRFNAVLY